jgi:3-oxoacid CoA-transferase subunit A
VNKVFESADAAINDIEDGATVMLGGFGLCGPEESGNGRPERRFLRCPKVWPKSSPNCPS